VKREVTKYLPPPKVNSSAFMENFSNHEIFMDSIYYINV